MGARSEPLNSEESIAYDSNGLTYQLNLSSDGYILMGKGSYKGTSLVIPSTINDKPVVEIAENAFNDSDITSVTIPLKSSINLDTEEIPRNK